MRVKSSTMISLALCSAAFAAALAHYAIDVVGDFALERDAYDGLRHGSREFAVALALVFAVIVAARGLRACCDLAQRARGCIAKPELPGAALSGYAVLAVGVTCALVPVMEWLDDALAAVSFAQLGDAFGGSLVLGIATTIVCAACIAAVFYAVAHWLLAHHDFIVAIVATLLRRHNDTGAVFAMDIFLHGLQRRMPSVVALCLAKRGPPVALVPH